MGDIKKVVNHFRQRVKLMVMAGIRPVIVLDKVGDYRDEGGSVVDAKKAENDRRAEKRERMWDSWLALEWENLTEDERQENESLKRKYLQGALRITPKLVWGLIRGLREDGISYIMSPGEADHQLVHLVKTGLCQYALTIDGDVLAHGIPVIRKFDFHTGSGAVYEVPRTPEFFLSGRASFVWAFLSGCDYTPGVHGIGPVLAKDIIEKCAGDYDVRTVCHAIVEACPKVSENRMHRGKPVPPRSFDELCSDLAEMYNCFERGVAYDVKAKQFTTLDGEPVVRFGIHPGDNDGRAQRYSLGLTCANCECECHRSDDYHQVGRCSACLVEGDLAPSHITFDMVPGSYMSDEKIFQTADPVTGRVPPQPTGAECKSWLKARSHNLTQTGAGGGNELSRLEGLWGAVRSARLTEIEAEKRGDDVIQLRSPNGECLHEILLREGKITKTIRCARAEVLGKIPMDASRWHDNLSDLKASLPHLTLPQLRIYFKGKDLSEDLPSVLKKAYRRIGSRTVLPNFRYCESVDFGDLVKLGSGELCGVVSMDVPASMRQQDYEVHVVVRTKEVQAPLTLRRVVQIESAVCGCLAGKGGMCVHVASVLAAVESIERPPDSIVQSSATSKLSWWNHKARWKHCRFDINQPLACLPYFQQTIKLEKDGTIKAVENRRRTFMHDTTEGRALLVPSANAAAFTAAVRNKEDGVCARVAEFFKACESANEACRKAEGKKRTAHPVSGDKSAFENTYGCEWEWGYKRDHYPVENPNYRKLRKRLPNEPPPLRKKSPACESVLQLSEKTQSRWSCGRRSTTAISGDAAVPFLFGR